MQIYVKKADTIPFVPVENAGASNARFKVVVGEKEGAPNFVMRIFSIEPNGHTPLHDHEWEHENYILKGSGELRNSKGEKSPVSAGDVVLVPPFEEHQFFNSGNEELVFICLIPRQDKLKR